MIYFLSPHCVSLSSVATEATTILSTHVYNNDLFHGIGFLTEYLQIKISLNSSRPDKKMKLVGQKLKLNILVKCRFTLIKIFLWVAFSALPLLIRHQEEHLAYEKTEWCGVGVVISLERGADCLHMVQLMPLHPKTPQYLASFKSRLVLPFWYWLTQLVPEKRPLNGCSSSSSSKIF